MSKSSYAEPVSGLLTYTADIDVMRGPWPDYPRELGLTLEHVPELLRMVGDEALWDKEPDNPEIWASVHAWRALAQLGAVEVLEAMVGVMRAAPDFDWAFDELIEVAPMLGPVAVPPLRRVIGDREAGTDERNSAAEALFEVARAHEEVRQETIAILAENLRRYRANDPTFNGFLIWYLLDLDAKQELPLIEAAYDADTVDESICGDVNEVLVAFGKAPRPVSKRDRALWELAKAQVLNEELGGIGPYLPVAAPTVTPAAGKPVDKAKAKAKRKAAKQARKKNR